MPDRDVFDRNVGRGWQTAARKTLCLDDDPSALPSVITALGRECKQRGCAGFDEIVDGLLDAIGAAEPRKIREIVHDRLDYVRMKYLTESTQGAVNAAKRVAATVADWLPHPCGEMDVLGLREKIAVQLLAELADSWMCPARVLAEIVEHEHVAFQTIQARRERAKRKLVEAAETKRLAQQLLADPSGSKVTVPKMARAKVSQEEILVTALT